MEELIQRITGRLGADEHVVRQAVTVVFTFLAKEGPAEDMRALMEEIDGAEAFIRPRADDDAATLGGLGGLMGGGVMEILGELQGLGLDLAQVQILAYEVVTFGEEKAGKERLERILASIPGLSQFV
ncbi:hypothetical protein [Afifella pfennigii]|uniref:hypothetical protein n=1 Tax=Afifella pfennigii TaxID=209897 RepID=UPI00047E531D|nr:hypothetical protein [Afifella pfennigii]